MLFRSPFASLLLLVSFFHHSSGVGAAQALTPLCRPSVTRPIVVASPAQRHEAGLKAEPPLTDTSSGFAWPDTPMGIIKTDSGYEFFGSDGGTHSRQTWQGEWVGNNKSGSVVTTVGTLDNPLGTGAPQDVSISPNPDPAVNPNHPSYTYLGGGPVYQVPEGMTGAGNLLLGYHAELPSNTLYAVHGLAASWDNGLHWTDLGEVVRPNQSFAPDLAPGYDEIGDGPLVLTPDRKYFYFYFPDWPAGTTTTTHVSVARVLAASLLDAAFGSAHPHAVPFEKFYGSNWHLQPGIGGASTDLTPNSSSQEKGYLDIRYNSALQRHVMIISNDTTFYYLESIDLLAWTQPLPLGTFGPIAAYPTSVGLGDNPHILGKSFYIYFTHLPADGSWQEGSLRRLTLTCP
ncbi:MAG TPA: hypothetical protein VKO18_12330 [Terriglobia bacterium]|nr:hypothetical protein [Terriglobia bacterium]